MNLLNVKNLVFDLGGVLLELNHSRSLQLFIQSGISEAHLAEKWPEMQEYMRALEVGKISGRQFYQSVCDLYQHDIPYETFTRAWDGILDYFPQERIDLLLELRKQYPIYLLSNTNALHAQTYEKWFMDQAGISMQEAFHTIWYSHEIGYRKPNPRIYQYMLEKGNLRPDETVFFDDLPENVEAAKQVGIQALQVTEKADIRSRIKEILPGKV